MCTTLLLILVVLFFFFFGTRCSELIFEHDTTFLPSLRVNMQCAFQAQCTKVQPTVLLILNHNERVEKVFCYYFMWVFVFSFRFFFRPTPNSFSVDAFPIAIIDIVFCICFFTRSLSLSSSVCFYFECCFRICGM